MNLKEPLHQSQHIGSDVSMNKGKGLHRNVIAACWVVLLPLTLSYIVLVLFPFFSNGIFHMSVQKIFRREDSGTLATSIPCCLWGIFVFPLFGVAVKDLILHGQHKYSPSNRKWRLALLITASLAIIASLVFTNCIMNWAVQSDTWGGECFDC
jgi:hypothetical protein